MALVEAYSGRSHVDAMLVRGLLEAEGLHAVVPGEELMDEFASATRARGGLASVYVPEEQLLRAKRLLEERARHFGGRD